MSKKLIDNHSNHRLIHQDEKPLIDVEYFVEEPRKASCETSKEEKIPKVHRTLESLCDWQFWAYRTVSFWAGNLYPRSEAPFLLCQQPKNNIPPLIKGLKIPPRLFPRWLQRQRWN